MNPWHSLVALRARYYCEYCHAPEVAVNFPFEIEHIVPRSREGTDSEENLALACRSCNLYKGDFVDGVDPQTGLVLTLFHPRRDVWEEHFSINLITGEMMGKTPIGRATIARLQINSAYQQNARKLWIRLELM